MEGDERDEESSSGSCARRKRNLIRESTDSCCRICLRDNGPTADDEVTQPSYAHPHAKIAL